MLLLPFTNLLNVKAEAVTISADDSRPLASDNNFKYVTNTAKLYIYDDAKVDSYTAYKILDVYYNSTSNEIVYSYTSDFATFLKQLATDDEFYNLSVEDYQNLTSDSTGSEPAYNSIYTSSTLNKLVSKYVTYIKKSNGTIKGISPFVSGDPISGDSPAYSSSATVEVGSYLIFPGNTIEKKESEQVPTINLYTYGVAVANVTFTTENNLWNLSDCKIYHKSSDASLMTGVFNTSLADMLSQDEDSSKLSNETTYTRNKDLFFYISYGYDNINIPTNTNSSILNNANIMNAIGKKKIVFSKTLIDEKYTSLDDLFNELYWIGQEGKGEKVTVKDGKLGVNLSDEGYYEYCDISASIDENENWVVEISNTNGAGAIGPIFFKLKPNQDVNVGSTTDATKIDNYGNKIISTYTYLKDPYLDITGMSDTDALEAVVGTATMTSTIYTYGVKVTNKDSNNNTLDGGVFNICTDKDCNTVIGTTTVIDNAIQFKGLNDTDTYYLKQIKAPTGYRLLTDAIELNPTSLDKEVGFYNIEVTNTKMGLLPSTGGLGTIFYTLVGLIVIGLGAYEVIKYSKKQVNS